MSENPKRSPEWTRGFKHLSTVQGYCSNYITSWDSQAVPIDRIWCNALFIRSVVALKSVLVLIHNDAVDDAAIIVRSLFEIEFQVGAIKNDSHVAIQLIGWTEVGRLLRLKGSSDQNGPLPEGMTAEQLKQKLEEAREFGKKLTKEALAGKADRSKEYDRFYRALSEIAHTSAIGLRHYFEETAPGNLTISPKGSLYPADLVMALASSTQLEILKIVRELREDPMDADLQPLLLENGQIIDSIRGKCI
jgi:hypothetical protein